MRRALGSLAVLLLVGVYSDARSEPDPGIVIRVDAERFVLETVDRRTGEVGPSTSVVVGSPAEPTPRGVFPLYRVILRPGWVPGAVARRAGAEPEPPSLDTPMGVAKIPFAEGGAIALHGAGDRRLVGLPVSAGCVRLSDDDLLHLLVWLHQQGALRDPEPHDAEGEIHRRFARPATIEVLPAGP